jgi:hypothetical protein
MAGDHRGRGEAVAILIPQVFLRRGLQRFDGQIADRRSEARGRADDGEGRGGENDQDRGYGNGGACSY